MQFTQPQLFTEALSKLGGKTIVTSGLNSEQWSQIPLALRERAFFSSTIESARFLQRARDAINDFLSGARETLPNGASALAVGSRSEFVKQLSAFAISEGMAPLDPEMQGGLQDITSQTRLNLIFDVQTQQATDFGFWRQGMDPDVLDEFPAQRFIREMDVKQPRPLHQENEGVVRLKTDLDFWMAMNDPRIGGFGVPWGPWGFNSGMGVEDVDRTESEQLGLVSPGETVQPVEQDFNDRLQASAQGLDPDILTQLQDSFGDQVQIADGAVQWRGGEVASVPHGVPASAGSTQNTTPAEAGTPYAQPAVSDALKLVLRDRSTRNKLQQALSVIDSVHDDGKLPPLKIDGQTGTHNLGEYRHAAFNRPSSIGIAPNGVHPEMTFVHEVGHFLDDFGIGAAGTFASPSDPLLKGWRQAIKSSAAYQQIQSLLGGGGWSEQYHRYLLKPQELFARSYAQYIAETSGDATLLGQLQAVQNSGQAYAQWSTQDFAPIRAAFDALFQQLGWI